MQANVILTNKRCTHTHSLNHTNEKAQKTKIGVTVPQARSNWGCQFSAEEVKGQSIKTHLYSAICRERIRGACVAGQVDGCTIRRHQSATYLSGYQLRGCQTTDKVGQLLWAWFSCPRKSAIKSVNHDTRPILSFPTLYDIS